MRILLVDDHTLFRDGLTLLIEKLSPEHTVIAAASAGEAFDHLATSSDVAIVLMDLGLPGMSGTEAIRILRQQHPDIPIVVLSGTQDVDTVLQAVRAGAMGFIPKSHSSKLLMGALHFILVHKGIYLPPELVLTVAEGVSATAASSPAKASDMDTVTKPGDLGLTPRQADVLYYVLQGKSNKAIARLLGVEDNTVRTHVTVVLKALRVTTRTEAVVAAHRMRLVFKDEPPPSRNGLRKPPTT
jgi:DNA-binding NarL/FixJ family response regulator